MIQEAIMFSKTCPNCGVVDGLVQRKNGVRMEWTCPKCGAVRFYSESDDSRETTPEFTDIFREPPILEKL